MWSYSPCSPDLDSLMAPVLLLFEIPEPGKEETCERNVQWRLGVGEREHAEDEE